MKRMTASVASSRVVPSASASAVAGIADAHDERALAAADRQRAPRARELGGDHRGQIWLAHREMLVEHARHAVLPAERARAIVELEHAGADQERHQALAVRLLLVEAALQIAWPHLAFAKQQLADAHLDSECHEIGKHKTVALHDLTDGDLDRL